MIRSMRLVYRMALSGTQVVVVDAQALIHMMFDSGSVARKKDGRLYTAPIPIR